MDNRIKKDYIEFISKQLSEMAENINKSLEKNLEKRRNNEFIIFSDENVKKYMGLSRSFDSQLGIRLQKIAMFVARRKYGNNRVPNLILLFNKDDDIELFMISYGNEFGINQKVWWLDDYIKDLKNYNKGLLVEEYEKLIKKKLDNKNPTIEYFNVPSSKSKIKEVKEEIKNRDKKGNGIPIDLFVFRKIDNKTIAYSYEIKAGGNLDTKNAKSNANEVESLGKIFSFCNESISRFATCYDSKGSGKPDGSITNNLEENQILIGKKFWKEILEEKVSYEDFIKIYKEAYEQAKVEEKISGKSNSNKQ